MGGPSRCSSSQNWHDLIFHPPQLHTVTSQNWLKRKSCLAEKTHSVEPTTTGCATGCSTPIRWVEEAQHEMSSAHGQVDELGGATKKAPFNRFPCKVFSDAPPVAELSTRISMLKTGIQSRSSLSNPTLDPLSIQAGPTPQQKENTHVFCQILHQPPSNFPVWSLQRM